MTSETHRQFSLSAPTVVTPRLVLRALSHDDIDRLVADLMSDPEVMTYLPVQPETLAAQHEAALDYVESLSKPWSEHGHGGWAVCLREPAGSEMGPLIGYCGFFESEPGEAGPALPWDAGPEFGFGYARDHWGNGYATEAATAALSGLFELGFVERVFATCAVSNSASRAVLAKCGMTFVGEFDLFNSIAGGDGLMLLFIAERGTYVGRC